jgi:hypothetical protein
MSGATEDGHAYYDHLDVDPPPRELTPTMRRYLLSQSWRTSTAFGLSAFFAVVATAILAKAPGPLTGAIAGFFWVLVAISIVFIEKKRRRLRAIVVEGTQRPARIGSAEHHAMPTNVPGVRARYSELSVVVDGTERRMVSLDPSLRDAQPGYWIRVLVHPDHPDLVVPVCSVT